MSLNYADLNAKLTKMEEKNIGETEKLRSEMAQMKEMCEQQYKQESVARDHQHSKQMQTLTSKLTDIEAEQKTNLDFIKTLQAGFQTLQTENLALKTQMETNKNKFSEMKLDQQSQLAKAVESLTMEFTVKVD